MKRFLVETLAAVLAMTMAVPGVAHADRWVKIQPAQCKAAFTAVYEGRIFSDPRGLCLHRESMAGEALTAYVENMRYFTVVGVVACVCSGGSDEVAGIGKDLTLPRYMAEGLGKLLGDTTGRSASNSGSFYHERGEDYARDLTERGRVTGHNR